MGVLSGSTLLDPSATLSFIHRGTINGVLHDDGARRAVRGGVCVRRGGRVGLESTRDHISVPLLLGGANWRRRIGGGLLLYELDSGCCSGVILCSRCCAVRATEFEVAGILGGNLCGLDSVSGRDASGQ
jgi:hypothetical protein